MDHKKKSATDTLILMEQKNEIRPYRKMQLIILIEIIVALSFAYIKVTSLENEVAVHLAGMHTINK